MACYSGFIAVIQQQNPTHFVKLADVPGPAKVHSLAVDVRTYRVYTPEQEAHSLDDGVRGHSVVHGTLCQLLDQSDLCGG